MAPGLACAAAPKDFSGAAPAQRPHPDERLPQSARTAQHASRAGPRAAGLSPCLRAAVSGPLIWKKRDASSGRPGHSSGVLTHRPSPEPSRTDAQGAGPARRWASRLRPLTQGTPACVTIPRASARRELRSPRAARHRTELGSSYPESDLGAELLDDALTEGARFAEQVLVPLNGVGGRHGCVLERVAVATLPGFKSAYDHFCEAGCFGHPLRGSGSTSRRELCLRGNARLRESGLGE